MLLPELLLTFRLRFSFCLIDSLHFLFFLAGVNLCSNNNGDCSQLCLPTSPSTRACMCTAGYSLKSGEQSCEGETVLCFINCACTSVLVSTAQTNVTGSKQVWALSCSTPFTREFGEFLSTQQTNQMLWCRCQEPH